jgi:hypothetical protein
MATRITFKKAFGIDLLPVETILWMNEIRGETFDFKHRGRRYRAGAGSFGNTNLEKRAIALFKSYSDHEIPTFDVSWEIELEIPADIVAQHATLGVADTLVEPHITSAFEAAHRFFQTYRDVKYD